jgi:hypothetical protein
MNEPPRYVIIGRSIEGEPTAFDEEVINYLSQLPFDRLMAIFQLAMGRQELNLIEETPEPPIEP